MTQLSLASHPGRCQAGRSTERQGIEVPARYSRERRQSPAGPPSR